MKINILIKDDGTEIHFTTMRNLDFFLKRYREIIVENNHSTEEAVDLAGGVIITPTYVTECGKEVK